MVASAAASARRTPIGKDRDDVRQILKVNNIGESDLVRLIGTPPLLVMLPLINDRYLRTDQPIE